MFRSLEREFAIVVTQILEFLSGIRITAGPLWAAEIDIADDHLCGGAIVSVFVCVFPGLEPPGNNGEIAFAEIFRYKLGRAFPCYTVDEIDIMFSILVFEISCNRKSKGRGRSS